MRTLARVTLAHQARLALRAVGFDRTGGKTYRRQQLQRACTVMDWIERHQQIHHLGQVGGAQVVAFWKAHRALGERARYDYWRALCALWRAAGKAGEPPRPRNPAEASENSDTH